MGVLMTGVLDCGCLPGAQLDVETPIALYDERGLDLVGGELSFDDSEGLEEWRMALRREAELLDLQRQSSPRARDFAVTPFNEAVLLLDRPIFLPALFESARAHGDCLSRRRGVLLDSDRVACLSASGDRERAKENDQQDSSHFMTSMACARR